MENCSLNPVRQPLGHQYPQQTDARQTLHVVPRRPLLYVILRWANISATL